jgi:hypothetical protein
MAQWNTGTQESAEDAKDRRQAEAVKAREELKGVVGEKTYATLCSFFNAYRHLGYSNVVKPMADEGKENEQS